MSEDTNELGNHPQDDTSTKTDKKKIITVIVILIAIVAICIAIFSPKNNKTDNKKSDFSAWSYARGFLAEYVKFPDTLIVLNKTESVIEYSEYDLWSYRGDYTAENAYGTKVRHKFTVIVKVVNENNKQKVYRYYLQIDDDVLFN